MSAPKVLCDHPVGLIFEFCVIKLCDRQLSGSYKEGTIGIIQGQIQDFRREQ